MNSSLEKTSIIEKEKLSGEFYFQSLLEQGSVKGIFSDRDIERLQFECIDLLANKVERFNAGDSSSIRVEIAQDIMESNLFTVGLWLKSYQNPDDAAAAIQNEQIAELYQKGRKRIDAMVEAAKAIHSKMLVQLFDTKNVFYRATIVGGINGFFKLYYPDFGAHEIHITADYPVLNAMPRLAGIEFIHAYLSALDCENQFCLYFSPDDMHRLLCSYEKGYERGYQELLINIYEPALTAAVGCVLTGTDAHTLDMPAGGTAYLGRFFAGKATIEILAAVQSAARELKRIFNFSDKLELYVQKSLPIVADNIAIAVRSRSGSKH
ncbi:MAG: DUF6179 domain-containing protein [Clostridiales bacterium]|nr:DUF6179 domain-containing protein [Clostridiales bacterium]